MESFREQLLILISAPIYVIIIVCEVILSNVWHKKTYTLKDTLANVYLLVANSTIDLLFRTVYLAVLIYFFNRHFYIIRNPLV
jgi:hypothetical protein